MLQTLSILMENEAGALSNMIGLFSQRALNIDRLTVVPTVDKTLSKVTLHTTADTRAMVLIAKQIKGLIDVMSVSLQSGSGQAAERFDLGSMMSETSPLTALEHQPTKQKSTLVA